MSSKWLWLIALVSVTHADPMKPTMSRKFTAKTKLGVNPTADQIRLGESADWRLAFSGCAQSSHQPPLRVGDPRKTVAKDDNVTSLEIDFECDSCGGATCPSNQYCVEHTTLPGIDAPVTSIACESKPSSTHTTTCAPAPGYEAIDQHLRCSPQACPKVGSTCAKQGATCGADVAAKASSFSNFMRCDQGTWQTVEVPPPPPPPTH